MRARRPENRVRPGGDGRGWWAGLAAAAAAGVAAGVLGWWPVWTPVADPEVELGVDTTVSTGETPGPDALSDAAPVEEAQPAVLGGGRAIVVVETEPPGARVLIGGRAAGRRHWSGTMYAWACTMSCWITRTTSRWSWQISLFPMEWSCASSERSCQRRGGLR